MNSNLRQALLLQTEHQDTYILMFVVTEIVGFLHLKIQVKKPVVRSLMFFNVTSFL